MPWCLLLPWWLRWWRWRRRCEGGPGRTEWWLAAERARGNAAQREQRERDTWGMRTNSLLWHTRKQAWERGIHSGAHRARPAPRREPTSEYRHPKQRLQNVDEARGGENDDAKAAESRCVYGDDRGERERARRKRGCHSHARPSRVRDLAVRRQLPCKWCVSLGRGTRGERGLRAAAATVPDFPGGSVHANLSARLWSERARCWTALETRPGSRSLHQLRI